jgi:hypothetical protein
METTQVINTPLRSYQNNGRTAYYRNSINNVKPRFSPNIINFTAEGGQIFFQYLKSFNLSKEPNIMFLPIDRHYYYDENDFKGVRTLINLKQLNLIKDLNTFLQNLFSVLPPDINFIGCFSDSKNRRDGSLLRRLSDRFNNFLDSRTDHIIDKDDVARLLEKYGFKVIDMKEMNGLTYFYSRNVSQHVEIRA